MVFQEGAGWKAPAPISILIQPDNAAYFRRQAEGIAGARGYDSENTRVGLLGEGAFGKYILRGMGLGYVTQAQVHLDTSYHGDGGVDATIYGQRVQIKTHRTGGQNAVTRYRGKTAQPIRADLFVFCEFRGGGLCLVNLCGWAYCRELLEHGTMAVRDGYSLLVLSSEILHPMGEIITLFKACRSLTAEEVV